MSIKLSWTACHSLHEANPPLPPLLKGGKGGILKGGKGGFSKLLCRRFGTLLVTFLLLALASVRAEAQATAQVTWVQGTVEQYVQGAPPPRLVTVGTQLGQGDRLVTKANAAVEFRLPDGSLVKLGELATVNLKEIQFDPSTGKKSTIVGLVWGKVRALVVKLAAQRDRFEIHTPTGVAGVTGTDWGGEVGQGMEDFLNFDGGVAGGGFTEPRRAIPSRYFARLMHGRIGDPQPIPPERMEEWNRVMRFQTGAPVAQDEQIDLALGALEDPLLQRTLFPPGTREGAPMLPPYKQEPPAAQTDFGGPPMPTPPPPPKLPEPLPPPEPPAPQPPPPEPEPPPPAPPPKPKPKVTEPSVSPPSPGLSEQQRKGR